ncbi:hypothetical protein MASR2M17_06590 [Aminivibrio sp.]
MAQKAWERRREVNLRRRQRKRPRGKGSGLRAKEEWWLDEWGSSLNKIYRMEEDGACEIVVSLSFQTEGLCSDETEFSKIKEARTEGGTRKHLKDTEEVHGFPQDLMFGGEGFLWGEAGAVQRRKLSLSPVEKNPKHLIRSK